MQWKVQFMKSFDEEKLMAAADRLKTLIPRLNSALVRAGGEAY